MKQVFTSISLIMLMCMVGTKTYAYDIAVENADGVEIYYNYINDGKDLEVTNGKSKYEGTVFIPEEVTFMNRTRKVTSIGVSAFQNCAGLSSVTIPNSVSNIGGFAFNYCSGLTSVTIPNSVMSIGVCAFSECSGLTSVTIPNSVTSIGESAFYRCFGLTSVHISDVGTWCKITFSDYDSNPLRYANHLYMNGEEIEDLVIPNSVTTIGDYAFYGCSGLTSITIPNSVTNIGNGAFCDCSGLTSITIPNSVTTIGDYVFYSCSGLTSITIPNSVTSIGKYAFYSCSSLTSVTIPNSVTSIENSVFSECSSLTSVIIPNSVTSIGIYAFEKCSGLTTITIPNSVTSIGIYAFDSCDLLVVISLIEKPFAINGKASDCRTFSQNTFNNATLYVPTGTIDKYKATDGWKDFVFIEEGSGGTEGGGGATTPEKCEKPTISYNNGKLTFTSATEGATCHYNITDTDIKAGSGNEVQLTVTYNLSVYATKVGYDNSETVTATLCWIDVDPKTEGIENSIANVRANPVMIQSNEGVLNISGIDDGTDVVVYSVSGQMVGTSKASGNQATVFTNFPKGEIAIVKIGDKSVKVLMQ